MAQRLQKKITKLFGSEPYSDWSSSKKPLCSKTELNQVIIIIIGRKAFSVANSGNKNMDQICSPQGGDLPTFSHKTPHRTNAINQLDIL